MTLLKIIRKISLFILLLSPCPVFPQAAGIKDLHRSDTLSSGPSSSVHSLYAGAAYGSNMIYLGSTVSGGQPFDYASVTYGYKNKLYMSLSAVHLSNVMPTFSLYTGSLNYSHVFNDTFDFSTGLYRYQVTSSYGDSLFSSFTYGDLTLGFDWKILYSRISAGILLSEESQMYFQLRNSRYFQTPEILKGKANISFDPYFNIISGTLTEASVKTDTAYSYSIVSPFRRLKRHKPTTTTSYSYLRKFGLLELDFGLPVAFNTDLLTIEAEPSYVISLYDHTYYQRTKGFVFQLSILFRIF